MKFMDKELKDIVVTLPLADGSELECGVFAVFETNNKQYFALLPLKEGELDHTQSYMLYQVEMDQNNEPMILYIESDIEYALAANYFSANFLDKPTS